MVRSITVAAAQLGPIGVDESREDVVMRLQTLMEQAADVAADIVVFPEAALTSFFPHWFIDDEEELDSYFERSMPNPQVQPLFDTARRLQVGFHLGYCELDIGDRGKRRFNSAVLVDQDGEIVGRYRKIHLPGHADHRPADPFQNLEKRYFEVGDLGFRAFDAFGTKVGVMICNDRRWPESYRVLGLQGAEVILAGYNTPVHNPAMPETDRLVDFHNQLSLQAGAYQNSAWVVGVAKAGTEEGVAQIGGTSIIAPSGEVAAQCLTLGDELIVHACDLDLAARYRRHIFDLTANRQPQHYGAMTDGADATD